MLCLNIRTTHPQLGLKREPERLEMKAPQPELKMRHELAQAGVSAGQPQMEIDSYQCRKLYGYKSTADIIAEAAQKGLRDAQQGTAKLVRDGIALMDGAGKRGSNMIARMALAEVKAFKDVQIGLAMMPQPKITITPGKIKGKNDVGSLKISAEVHPIERKYTPGRVTAYLAQRGDLRMWVTDGSYDIYA